jgi:uncharacterized protein YkwD
MHVRVFSCLIPATLSFALIAASSWDARAASCAAEISAYRRAHRLSAVRADATLDALARQQAEAMAKAEKVNHTVGGDFRVRIARAHPRLAAENVAAGVLSCAEAIKEWDLSAGHRENLQMTGARRVGIAVVSKPSSPYRKFWAMIITD